jgi:hypothetical protein
MKALIVVQSPKIFVGYVPLGVETLCVRFGLGHSGWTRKISMDIKVCWVVILSSAHKFVLK